MRKPEQQQQRRRHVDEQELELLKAVAQAWHAQSGNPKPTDEFHARRASSSHRLPTRFKLEAVAMAAESHWDFAHSLWDSYEIVTLSKKLEANVGLDDVHPGRSPPEYGRPDKRTRESKNSLRNLIHMSSSSAKRHDLDVQKVTREER
ncbi:hypothetical protein MUK42_06141 [Musa troglodytarum]|uniref:Uncharacterized protein n=1 Tax=Musa troglodytarum TaxID=320322 RepID=A0A9E7HEB0_9LILI|nr:hypothetical protein MUK42_06141 [Musa troglodytarum]